MMCTFHEKLESIRYLNERSRWLRCTVGVCTRLIGGSTMSINIYRYHLSPPSVVCTSVVVEPTDGGLNTRYDLY